MNPEKKESFGIIPIYKPVGMTSKDISRRLIRKFGKIKMGHAGTLDKSAEGVLPILIEDATKFQDYLVDHPKSYEFDIQLGVETDSGDLDGKVLKKAAPPFLQIDDFEIILKDFLGEYEQTPPIYSAIKHKGMSLHQYARKKLDQEIDIEKFKRKVAIYDISILKYDIKNFLASFSVTCGKGTYVRSLAKDICTKLKTIGVVVKLVRTASSGIELKNTVHISAIENSDQELEKWLLPVEKYLTKLPQIKLPGENWKKELLFGKTIYLQKNCFRDIKEAELGNDSRACVLYSHDESFLGICQIRVVDPQTKEIEVKLKRGLKQ